ncbi:MAG TPA: hypothetical protein VFP26_02810 [Gemmatimonadaceae bacterium]|jgi:hypothetical protein|nr:hypothetical protein [Gemmatimonadaceae bacterium]
MDLYIFCVVLGAAGMAAMALLGFTSSHGGGGHAHDTAGHEFHGVGGHIHTTPTVHGHSGSSTATRGHVVAHGHVHTESWKSTAWSWISPRVLFNVLVGFGATGLITEKLIGPVLALPVALVGGLAFEAVVVRPIFNSLFRFESQPAQTLESAIMSQGKAVTGFDVNGNGLVSLELGGEVVQILGTLTPNERGAGIRVRAGDALRIEDIDSKRNRCTVSRIGLSES